MRRAGTPARLAAVSLVLALVSVVGLPSSPAPASGLQRLDAPLVIETSDPTIDVDDPELVAEMAEVHDSFEGGDTLTLPGLTAALTNPTASVGSGITVSFDVNNPAPSNVQNVILAAVANWDAALATSPSGPVNVAVIWQNLGNGGLLGSAGPTGLYASASLPTSSYYPAALANTLLGTDLNGSTPELTVNLNSTANWYIGATGSPGSGQIDLYSVVLHELGHGLGFLGSASTSNQPPEPTLDSPSFVYDRLVTFNGGALVDNPSANSLLRSGSLYIDLSASFEAKIYAPATWQEGSSFSHFDEASYPSGWPGALMTPSLGSQQVERELDGPTLGVMAGMGWPMDAKAITPSISGTSATGGSVTVNWGLDLGLPGIAPDGFRLEAWLNGSLVSSTSVGGGTGAGTIAGLSGGATYTMKVVPHARGIDGVAATTNVVVNGAPAAPGMVGVSGSGTSRTISWSAPSGGGITGYTVQRSTDGVSWTAVGTSASTSLTATLPIGIHQLRVSATNGFGTGAWGYSIPIGVGSGVVRPVALDGQISRLYQAYFLREADPSGFSFWQGQRAAGTSLAGVSNAFAGSPEFQSTYGSLSNDAFVNLVYANVLNRPADPGGQAFWLSQLAAGVSRGSVMTGFSESAEMVASTGTASPTTVAEAEVYRLYVAFFLRFPDAGGYQYWVGVRNSGASLESIAAAFVGSTEFVNTYGSLPDVGFVNLVYSNVLARTPDTTGASYWQGQLGTGVNRGAMMVGFSESPEFVIATGTVR